VRFSGDLDAFNRGFQQIFGVQVSPEAISQLVAAPAYSRIELTWDPDPDVPRIRVLHPLFNRTYPRQVGMELTFQGTRRGIALEPLQISVPEEAPPGTGTFVFARLLNGVRQFDQSLRSAGAYSGIEQLLLLSQRGAQNGYYTWARLGADAPLFPRPDDPRFRDAPRVSDLLRMPGGAEWWRENGHSVQLAFDLGPQSRSSQTFDAYLRERSSAFPAVRDYVMKLNDVAARRQGGR
jgi:hypothetical protein